MKITPRKTARRVMALRVTSPEYREDKQTGKKTLLLSYADLRSNRQALVTDPELFVYAAGSNEEGELPSGLDRLTDHNVQIHIDKDEKAIGIDIVPTRLYRSNVVPRSQEGVETLRLVWDLGGRVCRVDKRPYNTRAEMSFAAINEMDKLIQAGKEIEAGMQLGKIGRIMDVGVNSVEIKLKSAQRVIAGSQPSVESIADSVAAEAAAEKAEAETSSG